LPEILAVMVLRGKRVWLSTRAVVAAKARRVGDGGGR